MPQLDQFTYFTQFFWLCLFFFTFYIPIWNDGDGVLGISRILKLRNQLLSHRGNKILCKDPNSFGLEDILRKGLSTGVSYMYSILFEVSQWCQSVDFFGKKITLISCFGEISGSRRMERNIFYFISKSFRGTGFYPRWQITYRNERMLIHLLHAQKNITQQDL
uniref:H(+)-transporting two-sector ATPase n=1 Tax=Passiflora edulis TaxID=78168 RepID=A0A7M3TY65_PASED|nr:ATPase subunit 8 [Passiflora edulis]QNZ92477.1 ATPase subunit 8 [Passiflora edulis]